MRKALPSRIVLWENIRTLMLARYGRENLTKLSQEANLGPATISRIKAQETSVGLDVLDELARVFRVPPWELIEAPLERGAAHPPQTAMALREPGATARSWPFERLPPYEYNALPDSARWDIETYAIATAAAIRRQSAEAAKSHSSGG